MRFKELAGTVAKAAVIGALIVGIYYGWVAASQLSGVPAVPLTHENSEQIVFGVAGLTMASYIGLKVLSQMDPTHETTGFDHR